MIFIASKSKVKEYNKTCSIAKHTFPTITDNSYFILIQHKMEHILSLPQNLNYIKQAKGTTTSEMPLHQLQKRKRKIKCTQHPNVINTYSNVSETISILFQKSQSVQYLSNQIPIDALSKWNSTKDVNAPIADLFY